MIERVGEPTYEDCTEQQHLRLDLGRTSIEGYATFYPQMGGYSSKAIVCPLADSEGDCCFDVYIWHDGEFPFDGQPPVELHHCSAQQFIDFGETLQNMAMRHGPAR